MNRAINPKLSIMMFLQFFVWGAWYTSIGVYMTAQGMGTLTAWPYTGNAVAAIVAPFFLGLVADRYFATEKVLSFLHLLGGAVLLVAPQLTGNPFAFIAALLVYNLCYMPTLGLANSLAFHHIQDQEKQFPRIRVLGTIGWIVAGLLVSLGLSRLLGAVAEQTAAPLYTAGAASIVLGIFCRTLPSTPPSGAGQKVSLGSILGIDAFRELGRWPFFVFLASSFLICIPLAAYYAYAPIFVGAVGIQSIAATMTIGQASEVGFMIVMPLFFARLGVKWMLAVGMLAWAARYALFALGAPDSVRWMAIAGIALHGICYDFFFVTGQIYVDKKSSPRNRGQAQGLLVLATYGAGMLIGTQIAGLAYNSFLRDGTALTPAQWQSFWWLPAGFAAVVLVIFAALFRDRSVDQGGTTSVSS